MDVLNEYEVFYKRGKDEIEITIEIDMEEYGKSFSDDLFHLDTGEYPPSVIKSHINEIKLRYLEGEIKRQVGDNKIKIGKRDLKALQKEVDEDFESYQEEITVSYVEDD